MREFEHWFTTNTCVVIIAIALVFIALVVLSKFLKGRRDEKKEDEVLKEGYAPEYPWSFTEHIGKPTCCGKCSGCGGRGTSATLLSGRTCNVCGHSGCKGHGKSRDSMIQGCGKNCSHGLHRRTNRHNAGGCGCGGVGHKGCECEQGGGCGRKFVKMTEEEAFVRLY